MRILFLILLSVNTLAFDVDLRNIQSSVKNQEDRNTCAFFGATALVESLLLKETGLEFDFSEQFQIYYSKEILGEYADREFGNNYDILMNYKKQYFAYRESDIPYQKSFFSEGRPCAKEDPFETSTPGFCFSQGPIEVKKHYKKIRFHNFEMNHMMGLWTFDPRSQQVIDELDKERPVLITIKADLDFWNDKTGYISFPKEAEDKCILKCYGHAIVLVGYDKEKEIFLFKNSWGDKWGDDGYGTLSFSYIDNHSEDPKSIYYDRYTDNPLIEY